MSTMSYSAEEDDPLLHNSNFKLNFNVGNQDNHDDNDDNDDDDESDVLILHDTQTKPPPARSIISGSSIISRPQQNETAPSINLLLPNTGACVGSYRIAVFGIGFYPSQHLHLRFGEHIFVTEIEYHCPTAVIATLTITHPIQPSRVLVAASNDGMRYGASTEFLFGVGAELASPSSDLLLSSQFHNVRRSIDQIHNDLKNVSKMEIELRKYLGTVTKSQLSQEKDELEKLAVAEKLDSTPDPTKPSLDPKKELISSHSKKRAIDFSKSKPKSRELKVFLSSTFKDMQPDRDIIVKSVFPRIRKLCSQRDVSFSYVDYRWGVTSEQSAQNQTLLLCLRELQKSDIVVGLLGERYGWAQPEPSLRQNTSDDAIVQTFKEAAKEFSWVQNWEDRSVTEVEMRMLLNKEYEGPQKAGFFFLRDPYYVESVENKIDYLSEGGYEHKMLTDLKKEIGSSIFPDSEYNRLEILQETLFQQLKEHLDVLFPETDQLSAFESEQFRHMSFQKKLTKIYLPDDDLNLELDKFLTIQKGAPIVVHGESGSGKSAFLANWSTRQKQHHPEDIVISHYIGASASSTSYIGVLVRLLQELQNAVGDFKDTVKEDEIIERFQPVLEHVISRNKKRRIIFVIDGLDHLEERASAKELTWLPQSFPANVKMILSTADSGKMHKILTRRGYNFVQMKQFQQGTRKRFIQSVLHNLSKSLSEQTELKLAAAQQSSNPLFLKTLLEEIILFGIYEEHDNVIEKCLEAQTVSELYQKVIERITNDFDKQKSGLCQRFFSLLAVSRRGLVSDELEVLMEEKGYEIVDWDPLLLTMEDMELVYSSGGMINFSNNAVKQAVSTLFLKESQYEEALRLEIAGLMVAKPEWTYRKCEELPYQYEQAKKFLLLKDTLSDLRAFYALYCPAHNLDLLKYWRSIQTFDPSTDISGIYVQRLQFTNEFPSGEIVGDVFRNVGRFLDAIGLYEGAYEVFVKARYHYDSSSSSLEVARMDYFCGRVLTEQARYQEAEENLKRSYATLVQEKGPEDIEVSNVENRLGALYILINRTEESEKYLTHCLRVRKAKFGENSSRVAQTLKVFVLLKQTQNKYDEAAEYGQKALQITENIYGYDDIQVARVLNRLAHLYLLKKDFKTSLEYCERGLQIFTTVYGRDHPESQDFIYEMGCLYLCKPEDIGKSDNDFSSDTAEIYLKEALSVKEKKLGDHPDVARVALRLGSLYIERADFTLAEPLFHKALKIYETKLGQNHSRVAQVLRHMITLYEAQEEWDSALKYAQRSLKVTTSIYGKDAIQVAGVLSRLGDLYMGLEGERSEKGLECLEEAIVIYEKKYGPDDERVTSLKKTVDDIRNPKKESKEDLFMLQQEYSHTLKKADVGNWRDIEKQCDQYQHQQQQIQQQEILLEELQQNYGQMPQYQQQAYDDPFANDLDYFNLNEEEAKVPLPPPVPFSYNSNAMNAPPQAPQNIFSYGALPQSAPAPPPPPPPAPAPPPNLLKPFVPPATISRLSSKSSTKSIKSSAPVVCFQNQISEQKQVQEKKQQKPMQHKKKKDQGAWYLQNFNRAAKKQ